MFHPSTSKNIPAQLLSLIVTMAIMVSWVVPAKEAVASSHSEKTMPAAQPNTEKGTGKNSSDSTATPSKPGPATEKRISEAYGKLPLTFEANQGQTDSEVKFVARGSGYNLFLTSTEAVLALHKPVGKKSQKNTLARNQNRDPRASEQTAVLRMKLTGANPEMQPSGVGELPGKTNYFSGADTEKWQINVPNYSRVQYREAYPGIDLVYYGNERQLEYDFVVAPGADPGVIKLAFEGANNIRIDARGDLALKTDAGLVRWQKPIIYQETADGRQSIQSRYVLLTADGKVRKTKSSRQS
ncbi:MAG: hypothetical protein ABIV48_10590, partial [Pyrinomonadaceae bacterium]